MSGGPFPSSQRRLSPFRSPPPTIQQQHMKCTPWEPEPNSSRWKCIEPESSKFKTITAAGLLLFQFPFWVLPPIVPLHRRFLSLRMDVPHPPKTAELNWSNQFLEVSYWQYLGLSLQLLYLLRQFSQFHLEWASLCVPVVTFSCQSWHLQESCSKTMMLLQSVSDALTASLIFHIFAAWRQHSNPDWFCNATLSICWRTACQLTAPAATRRSSRTHANPISWQKVGHWKKRKTQHPFHTPATKNIGLENWCEMLPRCHAKQLQEHLLSPGLTAQCSDRLWGSYSLWRELPKSTRRISTPDPEKKNKMITWMRSRCSLKGLRASSPRRHRAATSDPRGCQMSGSSNVWTWKKHRRCRRPDPRARPCRISFKYPHLSCNRRTMLKPGKCCDSTNKNQKQSEPWISSNSKYFTATRKPFKAKRSPKIPHGWKTWPAPAIFWSVLTPPTHTHRFDLAMFSMAMT